jgi:hypothetical protein
LRNAFSEVAMPTKIAPQIAAHHEAGHAVIGLVLEIPIRYATIKPRGNIRETLQAVGHEKDKLLKFVAEHATIFVELFLGGHQGGRKGIAQASDTYRG